MKRNFFHAAINGTTLCASLALLSCEKLEEPDTDTGLHLDIDYGDSIKTNAVITFSCNGDFTLTQKAMTRALSADGKDLTDVWVLDYMGEELKQTIHQASTDTGFGTPTLSLEYGAHSFYFVASRGSEPVVDTDAKTITWGSVRDTFHGSMSLDVQPNSGSSQSVSLSRCVGRLRVSATDVIPDGAAKLVVSPSSWYYGLNYQSGEGVADYPTPLAVNIPNNYIGTTNLVASFYTISSASPWQTDMTVALVATDESTIGSITISDVPLQRNHVTSYAGGIVGAGRTLNLGSNDEWVEDDTVSW